MKKNHVLGLLVLMAIVLCSVILSNCGSGTSNSSDLSGHHVTIKMKSARI